MTSSENQLTEAPTEELRELEELVDEGDSSETSSSRRSFVWLQAIAFLLGLGLLIYVINRVGLEPIFDALLRIGFFGFLILLAISGSRHVLRTIAMRAAVAEHRRFNFFTAFSARLAAAIRFYLHRPTRRGNQGCPAAAARTVDLRRAGVGRR